MPSWFPADEDGHLIEERPSAYVRVHPIDATAAAQRNGTTLPRKAAGEKNGSAPGIHDKFHLLKRSIPRVLVGRQARAERDDGIPHVSSRCQ